MQNNEKVLEHENVNGVLLSLKVDRRVGSPNSRLFTISYKSKKNNGSWRKISLILAILFNILAYCYIRISLTEIMVIFIVLSFLVFFWITHSVQSEILLVIPNAGIQSSVKYVFGKEDNFVAWANIDDVIINEVIKMNRVLYYLTLLVKNNSSNYESEAIKLIPLFKYTEPRLLMLEAIYSELQVLLTETRKENDALGSGDTG